MGKRTKVIDLHVKFSYNYCGRDKNYKLIKKNIAWLVWRNNKEIFRIFSTRISMKTAKELIASGLESEDN